MKQLFFILLICPMFFANAQKASEARIETFIDSVMSLNDIEYRKAYGELLSYSKKNYKGVDNVQDFVSYSAKKMKSKEKEYTKNATKEMHELHALGIAAHKNLGRFEKKLYSLLNYSTATNSGDLVTVLYLTLHEMNYWELNCFKPMQLGAKLEVLYTTTDNFELIEKINLFILASKIYKASYFVNPMHICESSYAKTEIRDDTDSLNLNTLNITIDSLPSGIKPPMFIGGPTMLKQYVNNNLKYPDKALMSGMQGRVLVSFKVDEWGNVYDPKIKQSPSEFLSKEAIRIVQSFPQWQPDVDTQTGAGFTKFTMPFEFILPEK